MNIYIYIYHRVHVLSTNFSLNFCNSSYGGGGKGRGRGGVCPLSEFLQALKLNTGRHECTRPRESDNLLSASKIDLCERTYYEHASWTILIINGKLCCSLYEMFCLLGGAVRSFLSFFLRSGRLSAPSLIGRGKFR